MNNPVFQVAVEHHPAYFNRVAQSSIPEFYRAEVIGGETDAPVAGLTVMEYVDECTQDEALGYLVRRLTERHPGCTVQFVS